MEDQPRNSVVIEEHEFIHSEKQPEDDERLKKQFVKTIMQKKVQKEERRKRSSGRYNSHYEDKSCVPKGSGYFDLAHEYELDKQSQKNKRSNSSIEVIQKTQEGS